MKPTIARIYQREFKTPADAEAFIEATHLFEGRISAVDMSYRLYQSDENPCHIIEIWEYPDEESMEWVQSSMEGAVAIPRRFNPETKLIPATIKVTLDKSE